MKDEPDIIKELKKAEKHGKLENRVQIAYKKLETKDEQYDNLADNSVDFPDDYGHGNMGTDSLVREPGDSHDQDKVNKYRLIAETTSDLICLTTFKLNPTYTYINSSYKENLGYIPEDMIGKNVWDFVHPDDKKRFLPILKKYLSIKFKKLLGGTDKTLFEKFESRIKDKFGNWHLLECTANIIGDELLFVSKDVTDRKEAEIALRQERDKAQRYLDIAGVMFLALDSQGNVTLINKKGSKVLGYKQEEIVGKNWFSYFLPDSIRENVRNVFLGLMSGEIESEEFYENPILTKDGITRDIAWHNTILKDDKGIIIGTLSSGEDVTDKKRNEEHLKILSSVVKQSNNSIAIINNKGIVEYANPKLLEVYKLSSEDIVGKNWRSWVSTDSTLRDKISEIRDTVLKKKMIWRDSVSDISKSGEVIWRDARIFPIVDLNDNITYSVYMSEDITDRKKAEEALKESEEKFKFIAENLKEGLWITDDNDKIIYFNKSMEHISGAKSKDVLGLNVLKNFPKETIQYFKDYYIKAKKTLKPTQYEAEVITPAGRKTVQSGWLIPKAKDGKYNGIVCTIEDITEKKKAEESLKESEERLSTVLSRSPIPTAVGGSDGSIISFNQALETLIGHKKSDISDTKDWANKLYPDEEYRKFVNENIQQALNGKKQDCTEFTITCKDGSKKVIDFRTSFFKGGLVIQMIDITDRKKAEEEIKEYQNHLQELVEERTIELKQEISERKKAEKELVLKNIVFESSIAANSTADVNGVINHVNNAFLKMWGYKTKKEAVGNPVSYFFKNETDATPVLESLSKTGKWEGEFLAKRKDGSTFISRGLATVVKDDDGKIIGYQSANLDVTNERQAEEELRKHKNNLEKLVEERTKKLETSEEKYRSIIENAPVVSWKTDQEGCTSYISSNIELMYGYASEEIYENGTKLWFGRIHPEDKQMVLDEFKALFEKRKTYDIQYRIRRKDDKWIWLHDKATKVKMEGNKLYAYGALSDVTDRKKAEEKIKLASYKLNKLNKELEQKVHDRTAEVEKLLKQKDEFISQLGHDIKNPLTPLVTLLPIILKKEKDPKIKELLNITIHNTYFIKNLVSKILELARLSSRDIKFNDVEINIFNELNNIIKNAQLTTQEKNITICNNVNKSFFVKADTLRIQELFDNLINNALKFTETGGAVTINAEEDSGSITVSVTDTGIGMTPKQLEHIFDEFYKADPSRHDMESSGLGLPICKRIVERYGGQIWAESTGLGKGSTFYFTLKSYEKNK